jgi:redox-sensitive bicupin YhaK (pirin superfamily)|tara:strand:+ start:1762 stop:2157 length:396 start_codon:yes stop_codon:yes gene_type:complete
MAEIQTQFSINQVPTLSAVLQEPMDAITRHHYENLATGKEHRFKDEQGKNKVSTVRTIQVDINGKPTLIPTIWDGQIVKNKKEAIERAIASGKKWPQRKTHAELRKFDIKIHEKMEDISSEKAKNILFRNK